MGKHTVAAVVVTYNRKVLLKECIESILSQDTDASIAIYVIDNASNDGTQDYIAEYLERDDVTYINTGSNLGGAGGFELGILEAVRVKPDYLWIMDDDTIPTSFALAELLNVADRLEDVGFLSSKAMWTDGSICTMNVQRRNIAAKVRRDDFDDGIARVQFATFVSLLIPRGVVEEVGAPAGEFFIWFDDWEYTRRISRLYPSYVVDNSVVIHKMAHNKGSDISSDGSERVSRYYYAYRNCTYVARRERCFGIIYLVLKVFKDSAKIMLVSSEKTRRLETMLSGLRDGLIFKPAITKIASLS